MESPQRTILVREVSTERAALLMWGDFTPLGTVTMSGGLCGLSELREGAVGIQQLETRDATKYSTAPPQQRIMLSYMSLNDKTETHWSPGASVDNFVKNFHTKSSDKIEVLRPPALQSNPRSMSRLSLARQMTSHKVLNLPKSVCSFVPRALK